MTQPRPVAYAFYDLTRRKERVKAIRATARSKLGMEVITHNADVLDALADAVALARKGGTSVLIGALEDLRPPEIDGEVLDVDIWREGIIGLLQDEGIGICLIDLDTVSIGNWEQVSSSKVIREYRHARNIIDQQLNSRLKAADAQSLATEGRKYGRPPYGYRTRKGRLEIDRPQAEAVTLIFRRLREGSHRLLDILREVKEAFPKVPGSSEDQYWDHVKLRRIAKKARLYCLGEFAAADGSTVKMPDLAFLPSEWADTTWPTSRKPSNPQE